MFIERIVGQGRRGHRNSKHSFSYTYLYAATKYKPHKCKNGDFVWRKVSSGAKLPLPKLRKLNLPIGGIHNSPLTTEEMDIYLKEQETIEICKKYFTTNLLLEAYEKGGDCGFALRDALLESGEAKYADFLIDLGWTSTSK